MFDGGWREQRFVIMGHETEVFPTTLDAKQN
jgi:hypothetical protein